MATKDKVFFVESPVAEALAWALRKTSYRQGNPGVVNTGSGCVSASLDHDGRLTYHRTGNPGASYSRTRGCWILHNTAWWAYGGAHNVVKLAASRLAKKVPEVAKPTGDLTLVGHTLTIVGEEGPDGFESLVWDAAAESYSAWQQERRPAPIPVDFFADDCDVCGRTWKGNYDVYVRSDHSRGHNNRRGVCRSCWEKLGLEPLQPDLTWRVGICAKCGAVPGELKVWVSAVYGREACQNCYKYLKDRSHWCICPKCDDGNTACPLVEELEVVHLCTKCGHKW